MELPNQKAIFSPNSKQRSRKQHRCSSKAAFESHTSQANARRSDKTDHTHKLATAAVLFQSLKTNHTVCKWSNRSRRAHQQQSTLLVAMLTRNRAQAQGLVQSKLTTLDATSATSESSNQQAQPGSQTKSLLSAHLKAQSQARHAKSSRQDQQSPGTNVQRAHGEVRTQTWVLPKHQTSAMKQLVWQCSNEPTVSHGVTAKSTD